MYKRYAFLLIFTSFFILINTSVGLENNEIISIRKSLSGFDEIVDIYVERNKIYVLELRNEKIKTYDGKLEELERINVERRFLRDIVVENEVIYGIQSLGLFKLYPNKKEIIENTYSVSSFEKKGNYFYIAKFTGGIDKYENENLINSITSINGKKLPFLIDITINNESKVYAASKNSVMMFDENLSFLKERIIGDVKGISSYGNYLLVVYELENKSKILILEDDLSLKNEYDSPAKINKVYALNSSFILMNNTTIMISNDIFLGLEENKLEVNDVKPMDNKTKENKTKEVVEYVSLKEKKEYESNYIYLFILLIFLIFIITILAIGKRKRVKNKRYKFKRRNER